MAQLLDSTITDEIRAAIEDRIKALKTRPELVAMADNALADIERDAALRRNTIATLFGSDDDAPPDTPAAPTTRSRGRKSTGGNTTGGSA